MSRTWRRVAVGALATATALAMVNGGTRAVADERSSATASPGLSTVDPAQDGRELFQGVLFLTGPQASLVAEAAQVPDDLVERNQTTEAMAFVDAVVAAVDEIDPTFFARFAEQLRSGDPFTVEQAITEGREMIVQASEQLNAAIEPAAPRNQPAIGIWAAAAVFMLVAAAVSVAVGVNVVVLADQFAVGLGQPAAAGLGYEQTIAALTEALAA
jgi:SdpC family antimicrobial peptide